MNIVYFKNHSGQNIVITNELLDEDGILQVVDIEFMEPEGVPYPLFGTKIITVPNPIPEPGINARWVNHPRYFESSFNRVFECPTNVRVFES